MSVRLVYLCVSVCVTLVVFADCESCTSPISTNPGSMEGCEYGLTRGTCFVAHRPEVVAVDELLWMSWCVLGGADFCLFGFFNLFSPRTPTACCRYETALPHLPLYYFAEGTKRLRQFCALKAKKPLHN